MNENEIKNKNNNTYRATTNLNIDMENPQIHMNSAVGMNIKEPSQTQNFSQDYSSPSNTGYDDFYKDYSNVPSQTQNNNSNNSQTNPSDGYGVNHNFSNMNSNNQWMNSEITENTTNLENKNYQNTQFISNQTQNNNFISNQDLNNNYVPTNDYSSEVHYEPTMEEKKRRERFTIPTEVKVTGFIVFILLIFVLLMPYIYDFFKNLQLSLTR